MASLRYGVLLGALGLAACGDAKSAIETDEGALDDALAVDGQEALASESDSQSLTIALVAAASAEKKALQGDAAKTSFSAGCLEATNDDTLHVVTFTLTDCTGPLGLAHVTGVVRMHYAGSGDGALVFETTSENLQVNGSTLTLTGAAELRALGRRRTLTWSSTVQGTTLGGKSLSRTTDGATLTWSVGEACIEANGTSVGTVDGRSVSIQLESFKRCRGRCPEPGSTINIQSDSPKREVVIRYLDDKAVYRDSDGTKVKVRLVCGS